MCETASRQLQNLLYAPQAALEGQKYRGGKVLRQERCPRGSSIPIRGDNATSDGLSTRPFFPAVPDYTPSSETLLRRTECGYTFAGSLPSKRGLA
jgi:hypothetical protein